MASAISIRVYLLSLHRRRDRSNVAFDPASGGLPVPAFVSRFISDHSTTTENAERERSWYFEEKAMEATLGNSKGYIHYGTFGFESDLVDTKTHKSRYKRQVTDSEIVPLFYEFWHPSKADHLLVVFQSFQGRSCVHLVMHQMQEIFAEENPGYSLQFRKLLPNDQEGSIYRNHAMQRLTLIKKNVSSDIADRYSGTRPSGSVNLEVSVVARRKGIVGLFGDLVRTIKPNERGVLIHEGIEFDEAVANVRIGRRTRTVGVFGSTSEPGVIDLSDTIKRGANGHPTFVSISTESDDILKDFEATLGGSA